MKRSKIQRVRGERALCCVFPALFPRLPRVALSQRSPTPVTLRGLCPGSVGKGFHSGIPQQKELLSELLAIAGGQKVHVAGPWEGMDLGAGLGWLSSGCWQERQKVKT